MNPLLWGIVMSDYRIIVAGGRDFCDKEFFDRNLDALVAEFVDVEIVSGHASGADKLAEEYAKRLGLALKIFPADWKKYGRAAGPIRNREMLTYILEAKPIVVAFWDGQSKGTKNMIEQARKEDVDCRIFMYSQN